jgi:adenylate cyclase
MSDPMAVSRKLVAVFAADVEGYSRLMGADEVGTLKALTERRAILDRVIGEHRGRIANTAGDSVLAEFGSAVDAIECAVEAQAAFAEANSSVAPDRRISFRIGVHIGEVMVQAGDLFGDGVNIAARLQSIAKPGAVCISGATYDQVRKVMPMIFVDLGVQQVKNIQDPVRAYQVGAPSETREATTVRVAEAESPPPLPDKPSIAVLPFENMSGDPEQEYFADGITEDIITALSRIPSLFVIARNSSFAYKGKAIDIRQIGRELGVRYLLEGSVRKAGQRLRITGQLVESETGSHLWADKFDSVLEDVFDLQDRVTVAVAGAIEPSIRQAEIGRANRKPTENLQAYDWLLRAIGERQLYSRDSFDRAIGMARRAIELDPRYAQAYAYLAVWVMVRWINGWMEDEAAETAEGVRFAHLAVQLAPNDSVVLTLAALALGHLNRDLAAAIPWLDRAIALNPNSAPALGLGAMVRTFAGEYATAIDHADRAMRLSPFDPIFSAFSLARGVGHLLQRQLPEAAVWLRKSAQETRATPPHSCGSAVRWPMPDRWRKPGQRSGACWTCTR